MAWLRIVTYRIPDNKDDALAALGDVTEKTDDYIRILRQQKGFLGAHWGFGEDAGSMVVVSYWSTAAAIEEGGFVLKYLQQRAPWPAVQLMEELMFEVLDQSI